MKSISPLRYPGGKGKLSEYIKLIFLQNDLIGGQYIEPYAGGASVALTLLFHEYVSKIHLNDLNPAIYSFWYSILNETDEFCKRVNDTPVTIEEWTKQKEILRNYKDYSILDLGFSAFFLNRSNRSGIISGGVIGGKNQTGNWKIDARFNKNDLILRIEKVASYRDRVSLYNLDAKDLITSVLPDLPLRTLIYLDPPYYVKGSGLYQNHYKHKDHEEISKLVLKIKYPWIVSYDLTPEIIEMYKKCNQISYGIRYSANNNYKGAEVMFFNKKVKIPDVIDPVSLKAS